MPFSDILGHTEIIGNLRSMVQNGRFPHAVLFCEKGGYGALNLALATIQYMFCQGEKGEDSCKVCNNCTKISKLVHPDIHFTFPINTSTVIGGDKRGEVEQFYPAWRELVKENPYLGEQELYKAFGIENKLGTISVAEANSIMRKLSLSSYEGGAKVMLIIFPERMNVEAANKLLKNLEEPQSGTYYFLISHNPEKIISTILSRCRIIEVPPVGKNILQQALQDKIGLSQEDARFLARCSGGSMGKALDLMAREKEQNGNYLMFLDILEKAVNRDLASLVDCWEEVASYGKEAQKGICIEGGEILRKLYMISLGMEDISYASAKETGKFKELSGRIKQEFYHKGYGYLNDAMECIERNVNPKFIFCDLCNRIFYNI